MSRDLNGRLARLEERVNRPERRDLGRYLWDDMVAMTEIVGYWLRQLEPAEADAAYVELEGDRAAIVSVWEQAQLAWTWAFWQGYAPARTSSQAAPWATVWPCCTCNGENGHAPWCPKERERAHAALVPPL